MKTTNSDGFDPEHLRAWWAATCRHMGTGMECPPSSATGTTDGWMAPHIDSHGARKRFIARARGRLLRSFRRDDMGDPLAELECIFLKQIAFIASHPEVPRRLLAWLAQDDDARLRKRVRSIISHFAGRLARLIGRARQQGQVRAEVEPQSAAMRLVGLIQSLALNNQPQPPGLLLKEASNAFALFRAGLVPQSA